MDKKTVFFIRDNNVFGPFLENSLILKDAWSIRNEKDGEPHELLGEFISRDFEKTKKYYENDDYIVIVKDS
jgi:hypothetical protein